MVNKNVKICDMCEKAVAEGKCFICKNDLCAKHKKGLTIDLSLERPECLKDLIPPLSICEDCSHCLEQSEFNDKEFGKELTKLIKPYLIKKVMVERLDDKKEDDDKLINGKIGSIYGMSVISGSGLTSNLGSVAIAPNTIMGIAQTNAKPGDMVSVATKGVITI